MTNTYNYSDQSLSGGAGVFEELVRSGNINNEDGSHTPKTDASDSLTLTVVSLPATQQIQGFDKRLQAVYEQHIDGGREYLTYAGIWKVEFLAGNEQLAKAYRIARIEAGESDFNEALDENGSTVFTFNRNDSENKIAELGLELTSLKRNYNEGLELTPYFTDMARLVDATISSTLLFHTLEEYEQEEQAARDALYFDDRTENRAKYYFGYETNDDAGAYVDYAGNYRFSYNSFIINRSKPLLDDLLAYSKENEYVIGRYKDGTLQFVLKPELARRLVFSYGNEYALATRYNDPTVSKDKPLPGDYKALDHVYDVNANTIYSVNDIFGITTPKEKK